MKFVTIAPYLLLSLAFRVLSPSATHAEQPTAVIPVFNGVESSLSAQERTTALLRGEREKIWEYYPGPFFHPGLEQTWWRPYSRPELNGRILFFLSFGGGRDKATGEWKKAHHFHALDLETGKSLWSVPIENYEVISKVHRGIVYLTLPNILDREDHLLSAYDLTTGTKLWVAPDSAYVFNVAIGDQAIVNARYPGYLRKEPFLAALDLRTGKELWRHNLAVKAAGTSEGRLFVLGGTRRGDTIFSLNPKTGKENWKLRLSGDDVWGINTRSAGLSYSKSEPNWAMDSGRIFAVINEKGDKGKSPLVAIDQDTGMILWERAYHKKVRSLIRAAYGKAYIVYGWNFSFGGVPGGDGPWINYWMEKLYAVDGATGRVLWDFGRAVDDFFLVSNGGVFLLDNTQGRLFQESSYFLLDANSGRKLAAHSGYGSFAGKMDEVEVEGEAVFPGLPYRWILKGPDGALWLLSYSPLPRGNEARNHALLMERLN